MRRHGTSDPACLVETWTEKKNEKSQRRSVADQFHAAHELVRLRASRNPNEVIEQQATLGGRIADWVARFGGSWAFINSFAIILTIFTVINIALDKKAWDPYPLR